MRPGVHYILPNILIHITQPTNPSNHTTIKMVSYRIITLLALAATGVIAAPCEAGNGNGVSGTGVAAASNAQATGTAGNAQGGAGGNAQGGASGNAQGGAAGGNAQGGGAGAAAAAAGGSCPPTTTNESQGPDNVGVDGAQFVTGQCTSDANCASGCCVLGGGSDPTIAVCRNEPALKPTESCGFTCN